MKSVLVTMIPATVQSSGDLKRNSQHYQQHWQVHQRLIHQMVQGIFSLLSSNALFKAGLNTSPTIACNFPLWFNIQYKK